MPWHRTRRMKTILQRRKKSFLISPIGTPGTEAFRRAQYALKFIFKRALNGDDWEVHRADEGMTPDSINQHVIRSLHDADLVIADLTGHNPNVFYELAVAHGIRKPVVHLISTGETIPFDIVDQRTIFYDITDLESVESTVNMLKQYADHAIQNADDLTTPLSNFARFQEVQSSSNDSESALSAILEQISSRLSNLEKRIGRNSSITPIISTSTWGGNSDLFTSSSQENTIAGGLTILGRTAPNPAVRPSDNPGANPDDPS